MTTKINGEIAFSPVSEGFIFVFKDRHTEISDFFQKKSTEFCLPFAKYVRDNSTSFKVEFGSDWDQEEKSDFLNNLIVVVKEIKDEFNLNFSLSGDAIHYVS